MQKNPHYTDLASITELIGPIGVNWVTPPMTSSSNGNAGDLAYDGNFFYICVATNQWKRLAISSWS